MRSIFHNIAKSVTAAAFLFVVQAECQALEQPAKPFVVAAKKPKCSAPDSMDFEGTDMGGITPKCEAIFDACVDESLACDLRKQKCAQFDKMDRDGSCYKKKR